MAIKVQIPSPLRSLTGGAQEVQVEAADVSSLTVPRPRPSPIPRWSDTASSRRAPSDSNGRSWREASTRW